MTLADIQNRIYFLTKTNSADFTNADMLIAINAAYNRVASLILQADGRWQWDDTNNTDLPIGTTALVSGQQDYSLAVSQIKILRVELKDSNGVWRILDPRDQEDEPVIAEAALADTTGIPTEYDLRGTSVFLWPVPNYSQDASLRFYLQRPPTAFTSADLTTGTDTPGFNSLYHDLISLWSAYDYFLTHDPKLAPGVMIEIQRKEAQLTLDYAKRDKDDRQVMTMKGIRFR